MSTRLSLITCPACGLLCDDIALSQTGDSWQINAHGCGKAEQFFQQDSAPSQAHIDGQSRSLPEAVKAAADLLQSSSLTLYAGLGTDVHGMRAVLSLAKHSGGYLDHMHSAAHARNLQVLQHHGWQTTTLTEVKQRADVIVIIASDIASALPRFFSRIVWQGQSLFADELPKRTLILLGDAQLDVSAATAPDGTPAQHIVCPNEQLPAALAYLHALLNGTAFTPMTQAAWMPAIRDLASTLQQAQYSVLSWVAKQMTWPHADLCIQQITQSVQALNRTTRSSALPLGGSDGDYSVLQVNTWQSAYPHRNRIRAQSQNAMQAIQSDYDPHHYSSEQLQAQADVIVWISCFNPIAPPALTSDKQRLIVIGHPALQHHAAKVFIPVAIPGLQQAGTLFRVDSAVSLPIQAISPSPHPSLASVLQQLEEAYLAD